VSPQKQVAQAADVVPVAIVQVDEDQQLCIKNILGHSRQFACAGCFSSGESALAGIPQSGAQIVLMDVKLPGMSGIECTRRLKALLPHLIIVMVGGLDDPRTISMAGQCGVDEFLVKPFSPEQLVATMSLSLMQSQSEITQQQPSGRGASRHGLPGWSLTARQNRLMEYMAKGLPYKEIAARTGVSEAAVHGMRRRVFRTYGATNKTEALQKWKEDSSSSP